MRKLPISMVILLLLAIGVGPLIVPQPASAAGAIIYVDVNVSGGLGNGDSWVNAFDTLQEGIDAASGDEVWVAQGTYKPTAWPNVGSGDREMHFSLKNGVGIYGGFDGSEAQRDERDWESNTTMLSGDIDVSGNNTDNCYHVFYHPDGTNLDSTAVMDGFTVTAGNADSGSSPHLYGGGMYNNGSSPSISNCNFSGNSAGFGGGGMVNDSSSPILSNCSFSGNYAAYGGGLYNRGSPVPSLINCSISGNSAGTNGGGISNNGAYPVTTNYTLWNCILWGNNAGGSSNEVFISTMMSSSTFFYCDIEGSGGSTSWDSNLGTDGGSNIDADPLFVNEPDPGSAPTTEGDLHIQVSSPCIDSGNNAAVAGVSTDFEGDSRIIDGDKDGTSTVDIGVDEYLISIPVGAEAHPLNRTSVLAPWLSLLAVIITGSTIALRRRMVHS